MLEDKLDRMIELLERILKEFNYPCRPYYPWWEYRPYEQPYYTDTTNTIYTDTSVDAR